MKALSIIAITWALLLPQFIKAQANIEKTDTTKVFNGRLKIISTEKDGVKKAGAISISSKKDSTRKTLETRWGSFDFGFNNYQDETNYDNASSWSSDDQLFFGNMKPEPSKGDFELRSGKSININIGIVKSQLSLYKHYVSIVSGITYDINSWSYKSPIQWNAKGNGKLTDYITRDLLQEYKKNKLVTNYLQAPLLLRIETCPNHEMKNVYLSAGGYAGYLVRVHTKQILKGDSDKHKQHEDFNITKFQYGAQFEIGYKGASLYFKKSFTPLTEFGTVQYPYSFGIRLIGL